MSARAFWIWAAVLTIADVALALYYYNQMPERVPIHWNAQGKVDGYGGKDIYLWMGPGFMVFGLLLAGGLPYLSPAKFKIDTFKDTFHTIIFFVLMLMAYINVLTMYVALHPGEDLGRWLVGGIFVFFSLVGNMMGRVKQNFYVGIRTPWTLANEEVWKRTHRLAGKLWFVGGLAGAALAVLGGFIVAIVLLFVMVFIPVVYSFVISKKLESSAR